MTVMQFVLIVIAVALGNFLATFGWSSVGKSISRQVKKMAERLPAEDEQEPV